LAIGNGVLLPPADDVNAGQHREKEDRLFWHHSTMLFWRARLRNFVRQAAEWREVP
jgi:hypothetical protein